MIRGSPRDVPQREGRGPLGTSLPRRKKLGKNQLGADKGRELLTDISDAGARARAGRPMRRVVG